MRYAFFIVVLGLALGVESLSPTGQGRFVATKRTKTHMRLGPDRKFPIDWVYLKDNYPFKIIAEFDDWYKVRDPDGIEGWVFKKAISGARWVRVMTDMAVLRNQSTQDSKAMAYLREGVLGHLDKCQKGWCRIQIKACDKPMKGWVLASDLWGLYDQEIN